MYEGRIGHGAWAVLDDDRVIGQFELTITGTAAWLSRVIIDPAQRGRGFARALVGLALDKARAQGAVEIGLRVIAGNEAATRAYLAAGFQLADGADRPDVLVMRRALR